MTPMTQEKKKSVRNGIFRLAAAILAVIVDFALIAVLLTQLADYAEWVNLAIRLLGSVLVLGIYSQYKTASMKVPWIVLILSMPFTGVLLYLLVGLSGSTRKMRRRYEAIDRLLLPYLPENREILEKAAVEAPETAGTMRYIADRAPYPPYADTDVTYFPDAAEGLASQLRDMEKAEHFIFMEYFAIEDQEAWHSVQTVLEERVKAGVEVRVFYDDMGSISFIDSDFVKRMEAIGIHCRAFNPVSFIFRLFVNHRDHRKLTVIDGKVGYTGGYNMANEYFNITHPYGMWKDTGIRMEGGAVRSLTIMFLEMWNAVRDRDADDRDFRKYLPPLKTVPSGPDASEPIASGPNASDPDAVPPAEAGSDAAEADPAFPKGVVQPYADSPMDNEHVGEDVYISMVQSASRYCYFTTPYLIITDEMSHTIGLAAKRGVDVRIITPGIPDKKLIYGVSRSFYNRLARNGVRIYEWTPGFIHSKMCIADGRAAVIGTINLDYRSLYHHFEDACLLYNCEAVRDIKEDFDRLFPECREVTEEYAGGRKTYMRLGQLFLRFFAELL